MFGWLEEIAPKTFAESIGKDDIRMLKNHNTDLPLARNTAGSLRPVESKRGLEVDADMTPTTYAIDLALSLEAGDVSHKPCMGVGLAWAACTRTAGGAKGTHAADGSVG